MKCRNCGADLPEGAAQCPVCGQPAAVRQDRPIITSRPRDENFDVSTTVHRDTNPDVSQRQRKPWGAVGVLLVTALTALLLLFSFGLLRQKPKAVVNVVESPAEIGTVMPQTTSESTPETEPGTHSIEEITKAPSTEEPSSEETQMTETVSSVEEPEPTATEAPSQDVSEAYPSYNLEVGGLYYRIQDGRALLLECWSDDSIIYVPSRANGWQVEEIGAESFIGQGHVQYVSLAEGIQKIGERAFKDCLYLKEVVIPDSVTEIGEDAFLGADFVIIGHEGSYAHEYALRTGYDFREGSDLSVSLEDE